MEPVIPSKAEALWSQLCGKPRKNVPLSEALEPLNPGMEIGEPVPLFKLVSMDEIKELSDTISQRQ
jgi:methionyl-tRNA synthetase